MLFSYPLPFEVIGELARGDTSTGRRTVKGAYYRLQDTKNESVEHISPEKQDTLIVGNNPFGKFSVYVIVLKDRHAVSNYLDAFNKPVIITLNGQNHGELTKQLLIDANLPELSTTTIVEIRLDELVGEALREIVSNSREQPKNTVFTRALRDRVQALIEDDEDLKQLELKRQAEKAKQSNEELNKSISRFLSNIFSNAMADPDKDDGGNAPSKSPRESRQPSTPLPLIPESEPPTILEFVREQDVYVSEGTEVSIKFGSDARPPIYKFNGQDACGSVEFVPSHVLGSRIVVLGVNEIGTKGYGSINLLCREDPSKPVQERSLVGTLKVSIMASDGTELKDSINIGIKLKPEKSKNKRHPSIRTKIILCVPPGEDKSSIAALVGVAVSEVGDFGDHLAEYQNALKTSAEDSAYWSVGSSPGGISELRIEINLAHPQLKNLFQTCSNMKDKTEARERLLRDIALDSYQHVFKLDGLPTGVHEAVTGDVPPEKRASEICLNFEKAIRIAMQEREKTRSASI